MTDSTMKFQETVLSDTDLATLRSVLQSTLANATSVVVRKPEPEPVPTNKRRRRG